MTIRSAIRPAIRGAAKSALITGGGLHPDALAFFARLTTPPTDARKASLNKVFVGLEAKGLKSLLDYLHLYAAADSQAARQNLIGDYANATAVNSPTFTADRGYQGNGSSSYLNTNYNPGDGGSHKLTQNSAVQGVWSLTNAEQTTFDIGCRTSSNVATTAFLSRVATNTFGYRVNENGGGTNATNTSSIGHFTTRRSGAAATAAFKDAVSIVTDTIASVPLANRSWYVGSLNSGSATTFSTRQYAASYGGASLTDQNIVDLDTILRTYLQEVGAA